MARRSCVTQLVEVTDFIGSQLDKVCVFVGGGGGWGWGWRQVYIIFFDMSTAFDKVSHRKLLMKLHHYGFSGNLLAWSV